jgi:hypothetical protein
VIDELPEGWTWAGPYPDGAFVLTAHHVVTMGGRLRDVLLGEARPGRAWTGVVFVSIVPSIRGRVSKTHALEKVVKRWVVETAKACEVECIARLESVDPVSQ